MSSYKLTYFDFDGGRAEPIRIAFHAAGIDFEDHRIAFEQFAAMRSSTRFNAVPVLEIDGQQVTQSNAICRYVGKMASLYPADNLQALYCDEVLDAVEDISHRIGQTMGLPAEELKQARETLVAGWLPIYLQGLDALLTRGGGNYFANQQMTMADLKVFVQTRWLQSGFLDHIPKDIVAQLAPGLAKHHDLIAAEPRVVAYYAARVKK